MCRLGRGVIGSGREAAEGFSAALSGAYVVVKRQHIIFPGLLVSRLIASIDIPSIDEMIVTLQRKLCVKTDLSHMGR
jgi:hypothetical protein